MSYTTNRRALRGGFGAPETYAGYRDLDPEGRKLGSVRELFVNAYDEPEYVRMRMGLLRLRTALIPVQSITVNEEKRTFVLQKFPGSGSRDYGARPGEGPKQQVALQVYQTQCGSRSWYVLRSLRVPSLRRVPDALRFTLPTFAPSPRDFPNRGRRSHPRDRRPKAGPVDPRLRRTWETRSSL